MVGFLIQRPVAVFMFTLALLFLGGLATQRMPTSLMPDVPIPEVTVYLSYPNTNARAIETNVVRPLRNQLLQVENLKDIDSESRDDFAQLNLHFKHGTNTNLAFIEVNEKIDASLNYLPRDLERPKVIKASATDIPILNLSIGLKENPDDQQFLDLSTFTETILKRRIEQLPDVAMADMSGLSHSEIIIRPKQQVLQSLSIGQEQLIAAIQQNNFELGSLSVKKGIYQYQFQFANPLYTPKDIEQIYLNIHQRLFRLSELAEVLLLPQKDKGMITHNGQRAILISVIKQAEAQTKVLESSMQKLIEALEKEYPQLDITIHQNQSQLLTLSIDNLRSSLLIGSSLAIFILLFFSKNWRPSLIIAINIPVALLLSLLMMHAVGLSINIISLSGLILGVGLMIDNSIIVVDNIHQKLQAGQTLTTACTEGVNEIISPLISSVLTTCSVFVPLLFLSGITGALFYDQALAISIGLTASLLTSIFLIPVLYFQLNKKRASQIWQNSISSNALTMAYEKSSSFFFRFPTLIIVLASCGLFAAYYFAQNMSYRQLPHLSQQDTQLYIDWNEHIHLQENRKRLQALLGKISAIENRIAQLGEQQFLLQKAKAQSFSEASIYLNTSSPTALKKVKKEISEALQSTYPNAIFSFTAAKNIFDVLFGNRQSNLVAQVHSKNELEIPPKESLSEIKTLLEGQSNSEIPLQQMAAINVIHENVLMYRVDYNLLMNELKSSFNENFIDNLKTAQQYIPIKLQYQTTDVEQLINQLFVPNKEAIPIAVRQLINIRNDENYKSIIANRHGEYLPFELIAAQPNEQSLLALKQTFHQHPGLSMRLTGNWFEIQNLKKELSYILVFALLILYFIMAAQFESLWQPFIILLEIPMGIGGALALLWCLGESINMMAAIGIIVMTGIVINDSILKIHTFNLLRKKGYDIIDAIKTGGKLRLNPILMTSLSTILALMPFLFFDGLGAELQQPLALTVIGGMIGGTFMSLYFIPLAYYWGDHLFNNRSTNI